MTLSYAYRCDICGELVTLPIDRADPQTPPDGWGSLTMHYPGPGPSHQRKHTCPTCTAALRSDESVNLYRMRTAIRDQPFLPFSTAISTEVVPLSNSSGRDSLPDAPSGLDPRDLECNRCGRTYHVDNYDPESPSGGLCLDCYRELLKKRDEAEKEGRL